MPSYSALAQGLMQQIKAEVLAELDLELPGPDYYTRNLRAIEERERAPATSVAAAEGWESSAWRTPRDWAQCSAPSAGGFGALGSVKPWKETGDSEAHSSAQNQQEGFDHATPRGTSEEEVRRLQR